MPTLTIPTKVYNHHQLKLAEKHLNSMVKGLKVEVEISKNSRGWLQVSTSGADQEVGLRYLDEKMGHCPTVLGDVEEFSSFKGYISSFSKTEVRVDIGLVSPSTVDVTIPLEDLQDQLVDGRKMPLKKITDLFSLTRDLPVTVKVSSVEEETRRVGAILSEKQLTLYKNWTRSLLDRLIVLGASLREVRRAVGKTRSNRDVIETEPLGFLEYIMVCKLGTDAAGLIPKIGRKLPRAKLVPFNPKRILEFLGGY